MAIIKPVKNKRRYNDVHEGQSIEESAEKIVCEWIEESITDDLFSGPVRGIINRTISGREADLVLVIPDYGILVVEIKAYNRQFVNTYTDDGEILCNSEERPVRKHPFDQAKEYVYTLMNALKKKHPDFVKKNGRCCVVPLVAMPNMSSEEYKELGLDMPYDIEGTLTGDWLDNKETFQTKFKEAVEFAFGRAKGADFDEKHYYKAMELIWPEWEKEHLKQSEEKVKEVSKPLLKGKEDSADGGVINKDTISKSIRLTTDDVLNVLKKAKNSENEKNVIEGPWDYSKSYLLAGSMNESTIYDVANKAVEERKKGTKIIMLCMNFDEQSKSKLGNVFKECFEDDEALNDLDTYKPVEKNDWNTFLFEIHFIDTEIIIKKNQKEAYCEEKMRDEISNIDFINKDSDVNIFPVLCENGKEIIIIKESKDDLKTLSCINDKYWKILELFGKYTSYNFEQFIVEHNRIDREILVTAGAGTGKTFSMLGRIAFLTHFNIINGSMNIRISNMIYMMTFTNNSTDEMRNRISGYFEKYYLLTKKYCYMSIVEQIGDMKIKTIDSMSKMILGKYAHILGLSRDFSIKSGAYIKKNIVKRNVQKQLNNSRINDYVSEENLKSYQLENIVNKIMEYIANRSIYLDGSFSRMNDERAGINTYRDFLEIIVKASIEEYHDYNIDNNTLEMESIGTWLRQNKDAIKEEEEKLQKEEKKFLRYLFVDEFQDTDKHQIELIAFFTDVYQLKLFVVGDRKQSIYGFRGAEDTAFYELEKASGRKFVQRELKKNYRTDTQLLKEFNERFNNKFSGPNFKYDAKDELVPQLNILAPVKKSEDIFKRLTINGSNELGDKLDDIIKILKNRIENQPTETKEKHKIAILTRTNSEIEIIRRLNKEYNWGIIFDNEGEFFRQDAVIDFYKLVCALLNSENPQHMYNLSLTPYCYDYIPRSNFYYGESDRIINLKDIDSKQGFPFLEYHNKLRKVTGLKLLRELVVKNKPWERYLPESIKGYDESIASNEEKGRLKQARGNYRKCLDQLFQMLIERNGADYITLNQIKNSLGICITTKQSMELYQDVKDGEKELYQTVEEKNHEDDIEITCTTVHKSKGLEYRSVILPFTTSDIGKVSGEVVIMEQESSGIVNLEYCLKKKEHYSDKYQKVYYKSRGFDKCENMKIKDKTAEELRILYVAMTRAKCEFYFVINTDEQNELNEKQKEYWGKYL